MKLISTKQAIDLLSQMFFIQLNDEEQSALAMAIDALNSKIRGGWIPVSEKWPNKSGHYITTYREWADGEYFPVYDVTRVKILRYHDAAFILPKCLDDEAEQDIHREVIAWQPLPETYKGDAK